MKLKGYIVLKFYERDKENVSTVQRVWDTIFLRPEYNIKQADKTYQPDIVPIYTRKEDAEADADWWSGHTCDDNGVVREVTIDIEDKDIFSSRQLEIETLTKILSERTLSEKDREHYEKELKEWKGEK